MKKELFEKLAHAMVKNGPDIYLGLMSEALEDQPELLSKFNDVAVKVKQGFTARLREFVENEIAPIGTMPLTRDKKELFDIYLLNAKGAYVGIAQKGNLHLIVDNDEGDVFPQMVLRNNGRVVIVQSEHFLPPTLQL